jgi:hypothetical protein
MNELISTRIRDHATRLALPHLAENLDGLLGRAQLREVGRASRRHQEMNGSRSCKRVSLGFAPTIVFTT